MYKFFFTGNFQNDPIQETKFLDSRSYPTSTLNYNQSSPDADRKIPGNH